LAELRENREAEEKAAAAAVSVPTSIASFIGYHLACKAQVGRHRPSERELSLLRTRLIRAGRFLHSRGLRDLREITRGDVAAYVEHLKEEVRSAPGAARRRVDYLSPATQRKYLRALFNMLKRARTAGIIHTNFVTDLLDEYDG
jgi:site-specific recombinase XerD